MSQTDTYRPAVLPSEAVMIPAAEAPDSTAQNSDVMQTAQTPSNRRNGMSASLEQMRAQSRMMSSQTLNWMDSRQSPLDGGTMVSGPVAGRNLTPSATPLTRRGTMSQGSALSTLMRSAARRYTPPPMMRTPASMIDPQPQMRGALRSVVAQAQANPLSQAGFRNTPRT